MTITHPYHPWCGQQVEVVRIRRGMDPDLVIRHPDGHHAAIAMSWTDYAAQGAATPTILPRHLLDVEGLRQAVQLIEQLRQAGRAPVRENTLETSIIKETTYDGAER